MIALLVENHIISRLFVALCFSVSMTQNAAEGLLVYESLC